MKKYKCNADCPDVEYGQCCHPESCIKQLKTGTELIAIERKRQIEVEGWTVEHDKQYKNAELFNAACCYYAAERSRAINNGNHYFPDGWPWDIKFWKPTPENLIRELEKAGALFIAHQDATGVDCGEYIDNCSRRIDYLQNNQE